MDDISLQEQKFLEKLFLTLRKKVNFKNDDHLITTISNKIVNEQLMPFNEHELKYLKHVLSNKLEDVCDCRNENEINFISNLLCKIEKNKFTKKRSHN